MGLNHRGVAGSRGGAVVVGKGTRGSSSAIRFERSVDKRRGRSKCFPPLKRVTAFWHGR